MKFKDITPEQKKRIKEWNDRRTKEIEKTNSHK